MGHTALTGDSLNGRPNAVVRKGGNTTNTQGLLFLRQKKVRLHRFREIDGSSKSLLPGPVRCVKLSKYPTTGAPTLMSQVDPR